MQKTLFMRCKYFGIGTCTTKYVISYFCFNKLKVFLALSSTFNNPRDYFHFDNETNFIKAFTKNIFLKIDWNRYSKANFRILVLYPIFFSIETLSFSNWNSSSHANKNLLCYFTNIEVSDCHSVENFEFFYPSDFTWNQFLGFFLF